jgi:peptidoglycan-associated lipoprotein
LLLAALLAAPAAGQTPAAGSAQRTTTPTATGPNRPALPTNFGDTGFWFVPTAETLPARNISASVYRANFDRRQGFTDISEIGITGAIGISERVEVFGSWRLVRIDRNLRPIFVDVDRAFGGLVQDVPYVRRGWSKTLGGPTVIGAKWNLISQSRGDAMSMALRPAMKFPSGSSWASTNDLEGHIDLVTSRELQNSVELTGVIGGVIRGDPEQFSVSDGMNWGLGASFPTRRNIRALVEWHGEFVFDERVLVWDPAGPYRAEDGSVAPFTSPIRDPTQIKFGGVWQTSRGFFIHSGANYSFATGSRTILGVTYGQHAWGWDIRLGWHPGTKTYVAPPPPEPVVREVIREVPAPAPPAPPPPNRNPTISGIQANPPVVEPGQSTNLSATATDPEGDALTYRWTAPSGVFSNPNALSTIWTAPNVEGNVPLTLTVTDNRGGSATSTITIPVVRRATIMFEDVHFDFDRFNLRPEALKILDEAITRLQANPGLNVTIEGHCDSVGTVEYNLALGERRSNSVRDYLVSRGIAMSRLRTVSYGEERPLADNNTAEGRALNRRAHLAVIIQ